MSLVTSNICQTLTFLSLAACLITKRYYLGSSLFTGASLAPSSKMIDLMVLGQEIKIALQACMVGFQILKRALISSLRACSPYLLNIAPADLAFFPFRVRVRVRVRFGN
jgi:hypothetical protein